MKDRIPNILRAGVILMVLTVWLPTAAVLVAPHENDWVHRTLETAYIDEDRGCHVYRPPYDDTYNPFLEWECPEEERWIEFSSEFDGYGWLIYGPITFGLLAGLYFMTGSLSLRPQRLQEAEQ